MLDFTSALYLGFRHPSASALPWKALTLGRPGSLQEPPGSIAVASELAALQGCEAATMLPSTLHLFWDLFSTFRRRDAVIYIEATTYAIARWGVQRASLGAPVYTFAPDGVAELEHLIECTPGRDCRPLIVCDGVRPGSDRQPPLERYAALAARHGGCLVLDDTQALGVLGHGAQPAAPLGWGGGGSLRHYAMNGAHILVGASLAKAFGVPVAVLSGSRTMIQLFEERSQTRVHASPPSVAVIQAARHALALNRQCGDALRLRLSQRVWQFRRGLRQLHLRTTGGEFPVQTLAPVNGLDAAALHAGLLDHRVRTVLHREANGTGARISFLLTASQSAVCVDRAIDALVRAVRTLTCRAGAINPLLEAS
jgi:8-amino-7-oxononanoate synthase